jgi:uncharacterized protein (TIGR02118 family)
VGAAAGLWRFAPSVRPASGAGVLEHGYPRRTPALLVSSPRTRDSNAPAGGGPVRVRGVHRLLVLYPPPSDPDHFRSYYEDTHLPLAAKFPGLRAYRYSFDVAAAEGESPYFCVFEADFDDAAALSAARASPEGQAVRADVPNYATGGAVVLNYELRAD